MCNIVQLIKQELKNNNILICMHDLYLPKIYESLNANYSYNNFEHAPRLNARAMLTINANNYGTLSYYHNSIINQIIVYKELINAGMIDICKPPSFINSLIKLNDEYEIKEIYSNTMFIFGSKNLIRSTLNNMIYILVFTEVDMNE